MMKIKSKKKQKPHIDYPRHWWFTCNAFTCYLETDKDDNVGYNSKGIAHRYVGQSARKFAKLMNRKFGGAGVDEFDSSGHML
jgi:hypothetical protein